jgi:hypothetical protein
MTHRTDPATTATPASTEAGAVTQRPLRSVLLAVAIALVAAGIVISRRPDAFTNAQFYAEDGTHWFSDAYNLGAWQALGVSLSGYFQTLSRLGAAIEVPFGVGNAPLLYNVLGLLVQIAPVIFFLSPRFRALVPSLWVRIALSAVYLLMPTTELNVTLTNAPFHLAVLATLVILAPEARGWGWRAFDVAVIALTAVTGPFVYVLLPIAVVWWLLRRRRETLLLIALLVLGLGAQLYAETQTPRAAYPLGANLRDLVLLLCDRVVLAGPFAEEGHTHVFMTGLSHATIWASLIILLAAPVVVFAALTAPWELRLFDLTALLFVAAGLAVPAVSAAGNQWQIMTMGRAGERYFFMAQVAWVVTVLWAASRLRLPRLRQGAWGLVAVAFASGLVVAWSYPAFTDDHWPQEARQIEIAPAGTHLSLPEPPGGPWTVAITVRGR